MCPWLDKYYLPNGTRVITTINSESLRKTFWLPIPNPNQSFIQFLEENNLDVIKSLDVDQTYTFMSKMFRPNISPSNYTFPYDISLFIETIQAMFPLLNQIIGLDSDQFVTEVMLGIVYLVSQSTKQFTLNFDQFMVKRISYQLEHFHYEGKGFQLPNIVTADSYH